MRKNGKKQEKNGIKNSENSLLVSPFTDAAVPTVTIPVRILIKPKKYDSPIKMQEVIEKYFQDCDDKGKLYSVEGLALSLGFSSTETLRKYGGVEGYEPFHDLVTTAKYRIQQQRVEALQAGDLNPIAGIFLLSNCHREDYKRDADAKEHQAKIESFVFEYEAPKKEINASEDRDTNEAEANG